MGKSIGVYLTQPALESLLNAAREAKCFSTRGPKSGTPSIGKFMSDVAGDDDIISMIVNHMNKAKENQDA